jgi:hypothetical protein
MTALEMQEMLAKFVKDRPTLSTIAVVVAHSPILASRPVSPCFFPHGYERMDIEILEWIVATSAARGSAPFFN